LCDELRKDKKLKYIADRIQELSIYDEFLISDCLTFMSIKKEIDKFWLWQDFNGSKETGIRSYNNVVIKSRYHCGILS